MRESRTSHGRRLSRLGVVAAAAITALAFGGSATAQIAERTTVGIDAPGTVATEVAGTVEQSHAATDGEGITAIELERAKPDTSGSPSLLGWPTPNNRTYHLEASCQPYASAIRRGAAAWNGLTETQYSGTPVECRNTYIYDCGGGGRIVGCNWGRGQRIALYMGGVNDDALLAAHEFGHDWYGHSNYRCAGWSSPAHVMAPSICNFAAGKHNLIKID